MPTYWTEVDSPVGWLRITADERGLTGLYIADDPLPQEHVDPAWGERDDAAFTDARAQLGAYFANDLKEFDLPLNASGTAFQREVWAALRTIPYGEVRSYRDIAEQIGRPTAYRAVGLANGSNPISIIIPCHRVIGSSGSLTGYGWGLERKEALLDLEAGRAAFR